MMWSLWKKKKKQKKKKKKKKRLLKKNLSHQRSEIIFLSCIMPSAGSLLTFKVISLLRKVPD